MKNNYLLSIIAVLASALLCACSQEHEIETSFDDTPVRLLSFNFESSEMDNLKVTKSGAASDEVVSSIESLALFFIRKLIFWQMPNLSFT